MGDPAWFIPPEDPGSTTNMDVAGLLPKLPKLNRLTVLSELTPRCDNMKDVATEELQIPQHDEAIEEYYKRQFLRLEGELAKLHSTRALEVGSKGISPHSMDLEQLVLLETMPGTSDNRHGNGSNDLNTPRPIQAFVNDLWLQDLQYLWNMYVEQGKFEEFCNACEIHGEERIEFDKGRLTAALFPQAFCDHLSTLTADWSTEHHLSELFVKAASLVVKELPYVTKTVQGGNQPFQFLDEAGHGDRVNVDIVFSLGGLVAICQKVLPGEFKDRETNSSNEYCIVQHNLTGAYLCRRVEKDFNQDQLMEDGIGILGLETMPNEIYVENARDDGSFYSGTLKDFSYKFVHNENGDVKATDKQCARKLFGHLKGAEFLAGNEYGLKM